MNFISNLLMAWGISQNFAPYLAFVICFAFIIAVAYLAHILFKIYLNRTLSKSIEKRPTAWVRPVIEGKIVHRLSHLVPAIIIYAAVPLLSSSSITVDASVIRFIQAVMSLYILIACVMVFNSLVYIGENIYAKQKGQKRSSIKSYVQVIRIIVYFLSLIVAISIIINKSPIALFTGLGALSAILLIAFKDTIAGFVASVQISSYDMVRVGDWVVLPKYGADGDVMEVSLNTVKIQNFDKTITTVPTAALLSEGMTNWRGMYESGGRRIKRSMRIDLKTVKHCDKELFEKLSKLNYLKEYIAKKNSEMDLFESKKEESMKDNLHTICRFTNMTLFRAYVEKYLIEHPKIHDSMTLLVRELEPDEYGIPLQLYVFTSDTNWNRYEAIQAEIFDHLIASLDEFGLSVYQRK